MKNIYEIFESLTRSDRARGRFRKSFFAYLPRGIYERERKRERERERERGGLKIEKMNYDARNKLAN